MIIDLLRNCKTYNPGGWWAEVCEFIAAADTVEPGKHKLYGGKFEVNLFDSETKRDQPWEMEAHRKYIDVQAVVDGEEIIRWLPIDGLSQSKDYNDEKDLVFFDAEPEAANGAEMLMRPGMFCILYPHDGHQPQISISGKVEPIRKMVFKIPVDLA